MSRRSACSPARQSSRAKPEQYRKADGHSTTLNKVGNSTVMHTILLVGVAGSPPDRTGSPTQQTLHP